MALPPDPMLFEPGFTGEPEHASHSEETELDRVVRAAGNQRAQALMADPPTPAEAPQSATDLDVGGDFEGLRWFLLPDEVRSGE